jgi:type IV secretion system protein VirB10
MSVICNILGAVGMTLSGVCADTTEGKIDLPAEDESVWQYEKPVEPKPVPKPAPVMPPVVIEKTVIQKVEVPAPEPKKAPPKPPKPNPYRVWLEAQRLQPVMVAATSEAFPEATKDFVGSSNNEIADEMNVPTTAPIGDMTKQKATYDFDSTTSSEPIKNDRVITTDRYITGILETGVNSQLTSKDGGQVVIQVSRDIFGYGSRNILIPKGSRLVCDYESAANMSATRIPINCIRILLAGDKQGQRIELVQLDAPVGDPQGRGGLTGVVNNHFDKQYGTALALSGISALVRGASAFMTTNDGGESTTGDIADKASQELGTRFGEITASVLEKSTNIVPTITIAQGKRVQIRPRKDWYIREKNS